MKLLSALVMQDCRLIYRELHDWLNPLLFFCLILLLFPLSLTTQNTLLESYAPAFIWIAALFATLLSIQHFFTSDLQDGYLQQSILAPVSFTLQIIAKCIAHCIMHIFPLLFVTLLMIPFLHLPLSVWGVLAASLLLGMPVIILLSVFCAALTIGLRQQGVIIGILIFPLIVPVIIFGINIVTQYQAQLIIIGPLAFLASLTVLSFTLLPMLISKTLKLVMS